MPPSTSNPDALFARLTARGSTSGDGAGIAAQARRRPYNVPSQRCERCRDRVWLVIPAAAHGGSPRDPDKCGPCIEDINAGGDPGPITTNRLNSKRR